MADRYSVSERLRAVMLVMLAGPDDWYTSRELAQRSQVPAGTVFSLVDRASSYNWVTSVLTGGSRKYRLDPAALKEIRDWIGGATPTGGLDRSGYPEPGPVRTLSYLVAHEPRDLVERVCEKMGWQSPYTTRAPARRS